jgi:hypothetical protein
MKQGNKKNQEGKEIERKDNLQDEEGKRELK